MADLPTCSVVVPIVAPRHPSNINQQSLRKHKEPKNVRSKAETKLNIELTLACLEERGLYAFPTRGDGNCLYHALSDQVYGDFNHSQDIRSRLANHIEANQEYFMNFMAASGGERRAPRRAAASAARAALACSSSDSSSSSPASSPMPTKDRRTAFESELSESRRNGVWGGSEQIQAFCQSFQLDVDVYTDHGVQHFRDVNAPIDEKRKVVHIAYHSFNHYSSVRNINGPHTGLPCISLETTAVTEGRPKNEREGVLQHSNTLSAMEEGLSGQRDSAATIEMLRRYGGHLERRSLQPFSRSSSPFSTGSKRSAGDSDADDIISYRPATRRCRKREQIRSTLPDVTVGLAFKDRSADFVSLRLRVGPDPGAGTTASGDDFDFSADTTDHQSTDADSEATSGSE